MLVERRILLRRAYFDHQVGLGPGRLGILADFSTRILVGLVGKVGTGAGAGFDDDIKPEHNQFFSYLGCRRDPLFTHMDFFQYTNFHSWPSPTGLLVIQGLA